MTTYYMLVNSIPISTITTRQLTLIETAYQSTFAYTNIKRKSKNMGALLYINKKKFKCASNQYHNTNKQSSMLPKIINNAHSIHAEMNVLLQSLHTLKNNTVPGILYIVRKCVINQTMSFSNSKPCSLCEYYLAHFKIKKIYYTNIINNVEMLCELRLI